MTDAALAKKIKSFLAKTPTLTVQELADKTKADEQQVIHVLHDYHPTKGHVGPGQGGPWVSDEVLAEIHGTP